MAAPIDRSDPGPGLLVRAGAPLHPLSTREVHVANGMARVGDRVQELPAAHHLQPCDCCLCRSSARPRWRVQAIGERSGVLYVRLEGGYDCPAAEVELLQSRREGSTARHPG